MKKTALAVTALALAGVSAPALALPAYDVALLNQYQLSPATTFENTLVGGLSSLDYSAETGTYFAISDDRGNDREGSGAPRFYELDIDVDASGVTGVNILDVVTLEQPDGTPFANGTVDPEGLRRAPDGTFFWSSEGIRQNVGGVPTAIDPFVRRTDAEGNFLAELNTPGYFNPDADPTAATQGVRSNFGFESTALSQDGSVVTAVNENALIQDGPPATFGTPGVTRLTQYSSETGEPIGEYVYLADAPAEPSNPPEATAFTGVVELLDLGGGEFLVLERTFAVGGAQSSTGDHFIEIYLTQIGDATNTLGTFSLEGATYTAMEKTLFADLNALADFTLTNVEGITFGPDFENGDRLLMLVGDNNFSSGTGTQFIALRLSQIEQVPEPAALALFGLGAAGLAAARRRSR